MPKDIDLSPLDPILERYRGQKDVLITVLQEIQDVYGYLPEAVLVHLSREVKIPLSRIYGVVTFYAQFCLTPRGRNIIQVCRGTACHVQQSDSILRTLTQTLGVNEGETTEDLQFSLETVACLGTCFLAPVMIINRSYYGKLDPQKARTIVEGYVQTGEES